MSDNVLSSDQIGVDAQTADTADSTTRAQSGFPALSFDADEFVQYVKDHDLSEAEAYEFLATVWVYVVAWVDLGFGVHPIQQAQKARTGAARNGKSHGNNTALDHESALVLTCRETFNNRTNDKIVRRQKRRSAGKKDS